MRRGVEVEERRSGEKKETVEGGRFETNDKRQGAYEGKRIV